MVVLPRTIVERIASFNANGPNSVSRLSLSRGQRGVRKTVGWLRGTTSQRIGYKHCCPGKILGREDKPCRFCTIHGLHGKNDLKC
jgi:hypothetical protein